MSFLYSPLRSSIKESFLYFFLDFILTISFCPWTPEKTAQSCTSASWYRSRSFESKVMVHGRLGWWKIWGWCSCCPEVWREHSIHSQRPLTWPRRKHDSPALLNRGWTEAVVWIVSQGRRLWDFTWEVRIRNGGFFFFPAHNQAAGYIVFCLEMVLPGLYLIGINWLYVTFFKALEVKFVLLWIL